MTFLLNVLSSIVAGIVLLLAAGFLSQKARWVLTGIFGRLLNVDVEFVFPNKASCAKDIMRELGDADFVDLFTGRGADLESEIFSALLGKRPGGMITRLRILLPQVDSVESKPDWTSVNDKEIGSIDRAYGNGLLQSQIRGTEEFLTAYLEPGVVEMRHYNSPHIGRIIITDRVVYFTPYPSSKRADYAKIVKLRRSGPISDGFVRLFNLLWHNAPDVRPDGD